MTRHACFILGGGFGGLYAALEFEKRTDPRFEVTVVNRENFFLFTPMLHWQTEETIQIQNAWTARSDRSPDRCGADPWREFSGFLAWFLWRGIYWSKLPRAEKKVRVAIDWALDVFFSKDFVQYLDQRALATSQTETGAAPWNRDQLSDPSKSNNRIAA